VSDKASWKINLIEDGMIVIGLLTIGVLVLVIKLMRPLLRWASK